MDTMVDVERALSINRQHVIRGKRRELGQEEPK